MARGQQVTVQIYSVLWLMSKLFTRLLMVLARKMSSEANQAVLKMLGEMLLTSTHAFSA